jgi:hypothetical protein
MTDTNALAWKIATAAARDARDEKRRLGLSRPPTSDLLNRQCDL